MLKNIKNKFVNADGSLNGKIIAGTISLLIVLVYQIASMCGFQLKGSADDLANVINVVLLILGMIGVVENPGQVEVPKGLLNYVPGTFNSYSSSARPSGEASSLVDASTPGKLKIHANSVSFSNGAFMPSQESDSVANSQSQNS